MDCTQLRHPRTERRPLFSCHRTAAMLLCYSIVTCTRQMVLYSFGHFTRAENLPSINSRLAVTIHVIRIVCLSFAFRVRYLCVFVLLFINHVLCPVLHREEVHSDPFIFLHYTHIIIAFDSGNWVLILKSDRI
jgi:hypothetical protein